MKPIIFLRYILLGLVIKIGGLVLLDHSEDTSTHVVLVYGMLLVGLLLARPLKNKKSFF